MSLSIPLQLLEVGEPAFIEGFCCDESEVHRLREMGLEPGVEVEMMQAGSPCIVRVGQKRLCMRCDELSEILVTSNSTAREPTPESESV